MPAADIHMSAANILSPLSFMFFNNVSFLRFKMPQ